MGLRLEQLGLGGLVTDGSVRDTDEIISYGFPCFSYSTTPRQGPAVMQPWECNGVISCGGVAVRPGDCIVGDQDGVVVVPAAKAEMVYSIAHEGHHAGELEPVRGHGELVEVLFPGGVVPKVRRDL